MEECCWAFEICVIGVAPRIVVGRLQDDKKIGYSEFNELKEHYVIA